MSDSASSFGAEFSEDDAASLAASPSVSSGQPSSPQNQVLQSLLGQNSSAAGNSNHFGTSQSLGSEKASPNEPLQQARQLLSPIALIRTASEQILGEVSPEEKKQQQAAISRDRQRMAEEQQRLEGIRQRQQMARQQQGQTNAALADQATQFMKAAPTHIGSSKTEQTLYESIIQSGQRQRAAQQSGASMMPRSTPKGPDLGNSKPKTDMIARMQPDSQKKKQSEPAAHELPLGE